MTRNQRALALLMIGAIACAGAALSPRAGAPDRRDDAEGFSRFFRPTPCAIFEPGTPLEYVNRVTAELVAQVSSRYDLQGNTWTFSTTPRTLRYSFVPDGLMIPMAFTGDSFGPSELHSRMNGLFGGDTNLWKSLFAQSFARWTSITGIQYTLVSDDGNFWGAGGSATRGDIRIAMRTIDGPGSILAFNNYPGAGGSAGDMVLDADESTWANSTNNYRRLRNVLMHEHGHGIGLNHICPIDLTKLMEPFLALGFDGPQHDDIRGAQAMYGDRFEPNNTLPSATSLGFLNFGASVSHAELGIRDINDSDVFAFSAPANTRISVVATPQGATYLQGDQLSNGSCSPGVSFNSLTLANLQLSILNSAGQVLRSANETGYGGAERILNYALPSAGTFYVRVSPFTFAVADSRSQLYSLDLTTRSAVTPCPWDISGDGLVDSNDLAVLLSLWDTHGPTGDLNADGFVNAFDLTQLLGNWGACPP